MVVWPARNLLTALQATNGRETFLLLFCLVRFSPDVMIPPVLRDTNLSSQMRRLQLPTNGRSTRGVDRIGKRRQNHWAIVFLPMNVV